MLVTDEVFHADNGWLNEVHPANIWLILVTEEVSQVAMDSLHSYSERWENNWDMSVINEVSQVPMCP